MAFSLSRLAILGAALLCVHSVQGNEPIPAPATVQTTPPAEPTLVERGLYVAQLGDCIACHTAKGGAIMAGGLELKTPMGTIYSSNITPDPDTGIGRYSFEQFDRAMREGVTPNGSHLYPAMPYPSYAKMTEEDMRALFAYLMDGVAPVAQANLEADMGFPFNQRWGLWFWNLVFVDNKEFEADPKKDAQLNRGAYLVQGLGHCGSCHTPRGIAFQEKAMSDNESGGEHYLAGETVEEWRALSLRNLWTVEDTVQLLKTGQNRFATVAGNMADVINHSTQHISDADLTAIAAYLKSLPAGKDDLPMPSQPLTPAAPPSNLFSSRGGLGYAQFCSDCHRQDGGGVPQMFPALAGNPSIASANPTSLLHITLTGWQTAQTAAHPRVYTMPGFAQLADEEIAEILSFVRSSWGNTGSAISPAQVKAMRAQLSPTVESTLFETPRLANLLAAPNAEQVVRGMRLHLETKALLPDNVGNSLNCTSCHLNAGTVADGSPFVGVSAFFPGYAPRAGKTITLEERINGCFRRSMNGKPLPVQGTDMQAMVAYFDWMKNNTKPEDKVAGRGVGKIDPSLTPNPEHGQQVYAKQCAVCHGADGEGLKRADGSLIFPPLWGEQSFNIGAGMARTNTAAAFVKRNMPIGFHEKFPLGQGGLSDQEALDVAEYFSHQPRPDFPDKVKDWPKDKKPVDARY
ncbi:c-type cytochrome [Pseudomonas sp. TH05]|uniref:c-type cytochrome n=1 Tax=unclassified Pseudomonas TaxID=196821 RepID=UPI0009972E51|nr:MULTISPECIES: c-type cytochrome [unclassified Pseudomonas]MBK5536925.1 c-type cytochrome [Pseudomonas sp. TH07]MBK5559799.1 c-type cytochrome [Pseudomonas sp. TH05]OOV92443.1 cytochrome C [Pseudomonas sp. MF4836]